MLVIDYSDLVKTPDTLLKQTDKKLNIVCAENTTLQLDKHQTCPGMTIRTNAQHVILDNAPIQALYADNAESVTVRYTQGLEKTESLHKLTAPSATKLILHRAHKLSEINLPSLTQLNVGYAKKLMTINAPKLESFKGYDCPHLMADSRAMRVVQNLIFSGAIYAGKNPLDKALAVYNMDNAVFSFQGQSAKTPDEFLKAALPLTDNLKMRKNSKTALEHFVEDIGKYGPELAIARPQGVFFKPRLQNS